MIKKHFISYETKRNLNTFKTKQIFRKSVILIQRFIHISFFFIANKISKLQAHEFVTFSIKIFASVFWGNDMFVVVLQKNRKSLEFIVVKFLRKKGFKWFLE